MIELEDEIAVQNEFSILAHPLHFTVWVYYVSISYCDNPKNLLGAKVDYDPEKQVIINGLLSKEVH